MEYVLECDNVKEVDYLIGDDQYKQQWMNRRRERWGIVAYNPKTLFGAALLIREAIGRSLRQVMHTFSRRPTSWGKS
jgi:CelD/BcsL family acetyltransferase involved in cellulose biosynthesis